MNIANWLKLSSEQEPTAVAIASGKEFWCDYKTMAIYAARGANWLRKNKLNPGDCIAIFMRNSPEYLIIQWAAWWAGLIVVPVNARLHPKEVAWIIEDSCSRMIFCEPHNADTLQAEILELDCLSCKIQTEINFFWEGDEAKITETADADTMWLFYTSGTTGRPKGVMLAARQLRLMTLGYLSCIRAIQPGDCALHPAPLSHGGGLYHLPYVLKAAANIIPASRGFSEEEIFELAEHWRTAAFYAAPTMVKRLAAYARRFDIRPRGIDLIVYGGAPMYRADIDDAIAAMGPIFAQIYGQGECPMTITTLPKIWINDPKHPHYDRRLNSVGHAHSMVEITIRDDANNMMPKGSLGEVCVRGDIVMLGYWRNHGATANAIRDGWLRTGDVGILDDYGLLTLVDRSKDSIISGGTNIYPREIEEALLQHPKVLDVSVIGRRCGVWGERVVAYVVTEPNVDVDGLEKELDTFLLNRIARFKRPRFYRFILELPKSAYGKVLKNALREMEEGNFK
jgi:long-chain acyl-CoA synthetase